MPRGCAVPNWRGAEMTIRGFLGAALAGVLPLLAACSGGQAPQAAQFVPPAPSVAVLDGPLRARYTLVPTLSLDPAVARGYGIERSEGKALLLVALRNEDDAGETAAEGQVQAEARDLSGRRQPVAMRPIRSGGYVDHVGLVEVSERDVVRVEVRATVDGRSHRFDFQRNF